MLNLNVCHIAGNITRDIEIKYTPKGTAIADIGLAVNRVWKDDSGEKRQDTTFVDATAFGKTAETIGKYCAKGHCIYIEARLSLDQWEDKATGQKRSKLKLIVEKFNFVSSPRKDDEQPAQRKSKPAPASEPDSSDDVPFDDESPF